MICIQDQYQYLVTGMTGQVHYSIHQFDNQEFSLRLDQDIAGKKVVVVGSLTATADQVVGLLLLLHTLKKAGVVQLVLFSPYAGYQRQDSLTIHQSYGLQWALDMLHAAGVEQFVTLEPHHAASLITASRIKTVLYQADFLFVDDIARYVARGFSFIFPDAGAHLRYTWALQQFSAVPQGFFTKKRLQNIVLIEEFQGKVSRKVIIYDDILDSGTTLVQVCLALRQMGVEEIVIFVTHAFFHGQAWTELFNLGVQALYCTNSLPAADKIKHLQIHVKSIRELLQKLI